MTDKPKSKDQTKSTNASNHASPSRSAAASETEADQSQAKPLQGWRPPLQTDEQMHWAIDQAFDYRGDVSIETTDGRSIEGYVYDRQGARQSLKIRMMPNDGSRRLTLSQSQIAAIEFTGKDTAEGRSFESWIKKYADKKKAGQEASIYHESGA